MFSKDSPFNSNELFINEGPTYLLKHLQRSPYGISSDYEFSPLKYRLNTTLGCPYKTDYFQFILDLFEKLFTFF